MPKQKQDIFVPLGPAIQFDQPGQKWNILKGVTVAAGEGDAVVSDGFDGATLVNKGAIRGPIDEDSGVLFESSDNATIDNRETGYIAGFQGLYLQSLASATVLNHGQIFGSSRALVADDAANFTLENYGGVSGIDTAVDVSNTGGLSGPLIENFGTMRAEDTTIALRVPGAKAKIKNQPGALIEGTNEFAIKVETGALKLINKSTIIGSVEAAFSLNGFDDVIINSGTISGTVDDQAVNTQYGDDTVINEGTITSNSSTLSAVFTSDGEDTVINEGTINGEVNLSGGDDVYKNKGGKVNGRIDPGQGNDKLVLGKKKDRIEFDNSVETAGADRIKNFESGKDKFFLEEEEFPGLSLGPLQKSAFARGTEAKGDNAQIVFNKPNGNVWFDPDGTGPDGKILLAVLDEDTKLTHEDFTVFA
ncbi:hypothetical protein [Bauldia sp.]|uniref:hypothetical protein n=1 Tax=Bauldia sp. TaxID=2575872 RepID=UPI003BAAEF0C